MMFLPDRRSCAVIAIAKRRSVSIAGTCWGECHVIWRREVRARLSTEEDSGSPSAYNRCMLFESGISIRIDGAWRRPVVIPTVIHFAPLLRARILHLWRDCALRLWTFIF